jgi:hypothetical protein
MFNLHVSVEFSSGSVQNGAFKAMCSGVAENSVVSYQIVRVILSTLYIKKI